MLHAQQKCPLFDAAMFPVPDFETNCKIPMPCHDVHFVCRRILLCNSCNIAVGIKIDSTQALSLHDNHLGSDLSFLLQYHEDEPAPTVGYACYGVMCCAEL